ncbi:MAG: phospholipid carrier-dependent glycosyltransferase [Myxococcota bacterium]
MAQTRPQNAERSTQWLGLDRASWAVVGAAAVMLLLGLGQRDLWAPDEPRYAQIADEVLQGEAERGAEAWLLLHLGGEPYTQKPPLYYWLAAGVGAPAGRVSEWAARLPSAVAGIACVALTALLGRRLFPGSLAGPWAAALLLTVFRFGHLARRVQLDVLLSTLELGALLVFWTMQGERRVCRRNLLLFHLCLGLALLTKGPVGLLPLAVAGATLAWDGRAAEIRRLLPAWGWALTLGPVLGWLAAAVALAPSGFFGDAVVENLVGRFFAGTSHARPFYYYAIQLPLDFMPWTLLWPAALLEARRVWSAPTGDGAGDATRDEVRAWRFLAAWVGVFVVFFSLSAGKRGLYLLPAFPALALICGRTLDRAIARGTPWPPWIRFGLALAAAAVAAAGAAIAWRGGLELESAPGFALPSHFGAALGVVGLGALVLASGRVLALRPAVSRHALATLVAVGALESLVLTVAYPAFDAEKSPRPIAQAAVRATGDDAPIGVFDHRSMVGGLAYYAGRRTLAIPDAAALQRFWMEGGGAVVIGRTKLERIPPTVRMRQVDVLRSGRRAVAIVVPDEAP